MTNRTPPLRLAGSAIAAALALASTPSLAQDPAAAFPTSPEPIPAPVIVISDIPAPVAPEPTVVLPTELPEPAPATSAETPRPVPSATVTRSRVTAPVAERTGPAATVDTAEPAAVEQAALPPLPAPEPVAVDPLPQVVSEGAPPPATSDNTGLLALIIGGLVFLALTIWGFVAIGRRKPVRRYVAELPAPKAVAPKPAIVEATPVILHKPAAIEPQRPLNPSFAPRPTPASGLLPHAGASIALPARVPESYAERDALMKRMIAARPDRANPFTDRGARTRRARLILQSLGRDFGETEPWIDLSQYPHNWPEVSRKQAAAA